MTPEQYVKPVVAFLITALPAAVAAQTDTGAQVSLPTIQVEAVDQITGREIPIATVQRTLATDMADVLRADPSVRIGGGARNAQRIYLRGIEGSNLNITINGARQGRALHQHRGGIGGIDPDLLKQVDIITGPSADLGPGALGGAIRFETVDAQDLLAPGRAVGTAVKAGYASADQAELGSLTFYGLLEEHLGLLAHVSAANREDYRIGGGGRVPNTAGQDRDYVFKATLLDLADHSLRLGLERNTNSGLYLFGSHGSDMGYPPEGAVADYQIMSRDTATLQHRYRPDNPLLDTRFEVYANDNTLDNEDRNSEVASEEVGGSLRNIALFSIGPTEHQLTVGADYYDESAIGRPADGSRIENGSRNLGLFLQERVRLDRLSLSLGVRFDDYSADYGPETVTGDHVSPNAGAELRIVQGLSAFAAYGEAVRGSGLIPVGWLSNVNASTNFNDGKPFDAEKSIQRETGLRWLAEGVLQPDAALDAELTLFDTRIRNTIERVGGGGGPVAKIISNPDTIKSQGFEVRTGWSWRSFVTRLGYTSVDTTDSDGNPVGIIRRKAASSGDQLVWDSSWSPREDLMLGWTLTAVAGLDDVPEGDDERPGYTLFDIQAQWQPPALRNLTLGLAVHNLFDRRYSDQTSIASSRTGIIHEPGRDIRLALTFRF
jgi:hemoglobin/transferrin/lactoferrin receptor protein